MADDSAAQMGLAWVSAYEAGLTAYRQRRWDDAIAAFNKCRTDRPGGDRASELMIEHCRALKATPPTAAWAAVTIMGAK